MGGGGGKGGGMGSMAAPPQQEAPKPYQQEMEMSKSAQSARENQLKKLKAQLGQQGSVQTSPFGTQQKDEERKTLLGG